MSVIKLSKRLSTVASFVRNGVVVADIGTDHAYLPIYLLQTKKVHGAIASDINEGPLSRARKNIEQNSLADKIVTYISDGLNDIEKYHPDDIMICGMGGELIAKIIDASQYCKSSDVNLILQPMTTARELRLYLKNGFSILDESIVFEDGKFYHVICAKYDGQAHDYTEVELEVGKCNISKKSQELIEFLKHSISRKKKIRDGLILGGYDTTKIESEIEEMEKML